MHTNTVGSSYHYAHNSWLGCVAERSGGWLYTCTQQAKHKPLCCVNISAETYATKTCNGTAKTHNFVCFDYLLYLHRMTVPTLHFTSHSPHNCQHWHNTIVETWRHLIKKQSTHTYTQVHACTHTYFPHTSYLMLPIPTYIHIIRLSTTT